MDPGHRLFDPLAQGLDREGLDGAVLQTGLDRLEHT